ncbi:hypothetical protein G6L37_01285 [Agrobacterium rubi]|nr:hypothetical protein [Agrobacterium rubi]NTF24025.1 hypothetical protein [Agrobacterium rubi]
MNKCESQLSELQPISASDAACPILIIGNGPRRRLFLIEDYDGSPSFVIAVDTVYGDGRVFRDECGLAAVFHETLAVVTPHRMVIEVRFVGSVFGIVDVDGTHVLEMELGAAGLGRGFSPLLWLCDASEIVLERSYEDGVARLVLFDGRDIGVRVSDGADV